MPPPSRVLLAALLTLLFCSCSRAAEGSCGEEQHDVESGMVRHPADELSPSAHCSWTYSAPAGRKLMVKVDSVQLPTGQLLQLRIDDVLLDIPRNCVQCLRHVIGGKVISVLFTSSGNETTPEGSFQIRYKAFDPNRCPKLDPIENGHAVSKGRKLGQTAFFHCDPPYDLVGDADAQCKIPEDSPVPAWSNRVPKCIVQDCIGESVLRKGGKGGAIASPGYPTYVYHFTTPCVWEIVAQTSQQIKASVTYLKFPKHIDNSYSENSSRLLLVDGESSKNVLNLTESLSGEPVNFTTLTSKLTVHFWVEADPKIKAKVGFYMEYSFVSSSCPKPKSPENGIVEGVGADLGSTISYMCQPGFVLVGEAQAECLFNRQWSHPAPSCEAISGSLPPSFIASNDSDTVADRLDEGPIVEDFSATDFIHFKKDWNFTEVSTLPDTAVTSPPFQTNEHQNGEQSEKENGPKTQPHLHQVIPPKDSKSSHTTPPSPREDEQLPSLDKGPSHEVDFGPFKIDIVLVYIIAGAGVPFVLILITLIVIYIYRKKHPVRMQFGRKFSTFENPMYVTKDVQDPRELKRLTN
ncbi:hypothetical protein JTE90_021323 [Oedothorax gibbosus]|uniref:Uncharacterized protein n=1 Tax=Oedothorax gibbosus TaxID=931172 RepID=A0AAV6VMX5_9ARAC|nr:hypothetical protein JTE90_021323 [Oedothorax gibbosus]